MPIIKGKEQWTGVEGTVEEGESGKEIDTKGVEEVEEKKNVGDSLEVTSV